MVLALRVLQHLPNLLPGLLRARGRHLLLPSLVRPEGELMRRGGSQRPGSPQGICAFGRSG